MCTDMKVKVLPAHGLGVSQPDAPHNIEMPQPARRLWRVARPHRPVVSAQICWPDPQDVEFAFQRAAEMR